MKPARHPQQAAMPLTEKVRKLEVGALREPTPVGAAGLALLSYGAGNGSQESGTSGFISNGVNLGSAQGDRVVYNLAGSLSSLVLPASADDTWDMWSILVNQTITAEVADLGGLTSVAVVCTALNVVGETLLMPVDPVYGIKWTHNTNMVYPSTPGSDTEVVIASAVRDPNESTYYNHTYNTNVTLMYFATVDSSFSI